MMLSRRAFLTSSAALAIAPALPSIAAPVAAPAEAAPATTIWVGGHDGEFDWRPFDATSREDAARQLLAYHGRDIDLDGRPYTLEDACMSLERAHKMDGLQVDEIRSHHWIRAGFGSFCERCDSECFAFDGARVISGEVVCQECVTITDLLADGDDDDAQERLVEIMIDEECDEGAVFSILVRDNDMSVITPEFWIKCLGEARMYT
ncbi:hypothetical protein [Rhizobium wuzhouense]|uniref:Twin-arginine translocation signal domain-containing protein n=1 Tax=Rhizobium wuzhouense TaxID=1986026 RepID=A0ABX5NMH4_9HYPH|nr:hypothetical protein [Rhizobium wuzhouense]PYB71306.1 hypothetical protein DMY87_18285 [Rhizobium wuzhouense]